MNHTVKFTTTVTQVVKTVAMAEIDVKTKLKDVDDVALYYNRFQCDKFNSMHNG